MISNVIEGARAARQTIFFPPEEPWSDRPLEPVHDGLAEPAEPGDNALQVGPKSLAEAGTLEAAPLQTSQDERVEELVSPAANVTCYAWIREVTQAGGGAVFRAEEAETGNLVTVELLSQAASRDAKQVRLFYLEAEAAARLQHPNIARSYEAEPFALTHQRRASHLPGGETLRELLARGGWFDPARAVRIIAQVADALAYAHQSGVLHLNLQPEQIWLGSDDWVFVTGFGIADDEQLEWARCLRTAHCAPPYLSPEQLGGYSGNHASDLYALGVIFYEMLTDRVPFDSNDLNQLRRRHKIKTPRPPQDLNHDLPPELSETVMGLLTRDQDARVRLFGGAAGLKSLLSEIGISAPAQRLMNAMPLSEIAAEAGASLAALVPRPAAPGRIEIEFIHPPLPNAQQHSQHHYRSVLALVALVMLPWIILFAIQQRMGRRESSPQQQASQTGQAPSVTVDLGQTTARSNAEVAAPPVTAGRANNTSGNPIADAQGNGTVADDVITGPPAMPRTASRSAPTAPPPAGEAAKTGDFAFGAPLRRVGPIYPASSRARHVTGMVVVELSLDEKGHVIQARAVSGPDVLRASAITAARQWQFTPATLNGVPVQVTRKITFHYDRPEGYAIRQPREQAQVQSQNTRRTAKGKFLNSRNRRRH